MPSIGGPELIIILLIVVVVFGVGRLPEVGGGLGKGIREFRRAVTGRGDNSTEDADQSKNDNEAA